MLYLITNRKLIKKNNIYWIIEEALRGGIDAIILREKDLNYKDLYPMAKKIKEIIGIRPIPLIINRNKEVALDVGAEGYHTGFNDFIADKVQYPGMLGISVHSIEEAVGAEKLGASYVLVGHIFETQCKEGLKPRGIELIEKIKKEISIPIIAIGGIKPENIRQVMSYGADGGAVMSYIMEAENPCEAVKLFKNKISKG